MSLPTPPEAPKKLAQKQETPGDVYFYDKNDTSPIPLTYDVIDFGKPQGGANPLVGWACWRTCLLLDVLLCLPVLWTRHRS